MLRLVALAGALAQLLACGAAATDARFTNIASADALAPASALRPAESVAQFQLLEPQPTCSKKNATSSSTVVGGRVAIKLQSSSPPAYADQMCCDIATPGSVSADAANYYTVVDVGPSEEHPDERVYICTMYEANPDAPIRIVAGNASTSAGVAARRELPDPHCPIRPTLEACHADYHRSPAVLEPPCAWWGGACHYDPPIECSSVMTEAMQPFCINIILAERPFPGAEKSSSAAAATVGRSLRPFNWTSGTLSQGAEAVAVMPAQILREGQSSWWSLDSNAAPAWKACVQYNELSADNSTSDPNSGFVACVAKSAIGIDGTRGTTNQLDSWAGFGQAIPGFSTNQSFWAQFVFWSNSTA